MSKGSAERQSSHTCPEPYRREEAIRVNNVQLTPLEALGITIKAEIEAAETYERLANLAKNHALKENTTGLVQRLRGFFALIT